MDPTSPNTSKFEESKRKFRERYERENKKMRAAKFIPEDELPSTSKRGRSPRSRPIKTQKPNISKMRQTPPPPMPEGPIFYQMSKSAPQETI